MAFITSAIIVLILSHTAYALTSRSIPATWRRYIDRVCMACITSRAGGILPEMEYLLLCLDYQKTNLHCVSPNTFLSLRDLRIIDQDNPCGFIEFSNRFERYLHQQQHLLWTITVHQHFFMNFTFLEFVLSMPYGKCDLNQGSERLVIASKTIVPENHLSFCGERSTFSVLWKASDAVIVYKSVLPVTEAGRFLIQYQVCEKKAIMPKRQTVDHTSLLEPLTPMQLRTNAITHFEMGKHVVFYIIHLLGNRLRVLDLSLIMESIKSPSIIVHAFDGPGPAEIHRHVDEDYLMNGDWIYFLTFQAYLRVECEIKCVKLLIQYQWQSVEQFATRFILDGQVNFNDSDGECSIENRHALYCIYALKMLDTRENIHITLDYIRFVGPHYLGDFNEDHNCLLAGVTIADGYRVGVMDQTTTMWEGKFQYLGDMPEELAIDYLLPEITTCYKVPFIDGDDSSQTAYEFPLNKTVSSGSWTYLLVYAYGAYIDLKKSTFELTISPTTCIGFVLSCISIPSDGFIEIGSASFVPPGAEQKELSCPYGNMLIAMINFGSGRMKTKIEICTQKDTGRTTVAVESNLIASSDESDGRCLVVQMNPHTTTGYKECSLIANDAVAHKPLNYNIYTQETRSMYCWREPSHAESLYYLMVEGFKDQLNSSNNLLLQGQNRYSGKFVKLQVNVMSACTKLEVNATLLCMQPQIQEHPPTIQSAGRDLQQSYIVVPCKHYSISVGQDFTHVVYGAPQRRMLEMVDYIQNSMEMDSLLRVMMNWDIGLSAIISSLMLNEQCSLKCRLFKVQIAYWSVAKWEAILLDWHVFFKTNSYEIKVFDLPFAETLIYITPLGGCEEQRCFMDVDLKFTDSKALPFSKAIASDNKHTTFAEYVLYWTSQEYTWYEAEDVCRRTGDMHLASITNEEEYTLVQGILAGDTSVDEFQEATGILTLCRLGSPLCAIYLGLQVQGSKFAWRDGRSHGFISLHDNCFENITRRRKEHGNDLQQVISPQYSGVSCSMLTGSPGPTYMGFVNVSCNQKLKVSGIMCIRAGQIIQQQSRPYYRLTHFRRNGNSLPSTGGDINVAMIHSAVSESINASEASSTGNILDKLTAEAYFSLNQTLQNSTTWVWDESWLACNQTPVLCEILSANSSTSTSSDDIHKLTQQIVVDADGIIPPNVGSVYISHDSLVSSDYCPQLTFMTEQGCVYLVEKTAMLNSISKENLDDICANHISDSRVYALSGSASDKDILRRLTERRSTLSVNQNEDVAVIISDGNEVHWYSTFGESSEASLILCSVDPLSPKCPVRYSRCKHGCISELLLCDGKIDCDDGEDESECHDMCELLSLTTPVMYCLNECHPDNCSCSDLYFQCPSGGCLLSSKLCDGRSDCKDKSDESICTKSFAQINPEQHYADIGYLLPAHSTKSQCLLPTLGNQSATTCSTLNHLHCLSGHSSCYPMDKRCLYDHTEQGNLKYCRTGRHLDGCQNVNCSGSFKCYNSYCVPAHKVCNGELDCPYGDDERLCPIRACHNMLRCGNICVHPINICDGTKNCKHGDDELLCDLPACPDGCTCNGYAIRCTSASMFEVSFKHVRIMSIKYSNLLSIISTFAYFVDLLFLDIAYNSIGIIPETSIFQMQKALIKLDLSHNIVKYLQVGSLDGLTNLQELNLSWNPLKYLERHVLDGLVNLHILSLSHCDLIATPNIDLLEAHVLDILDISHAKILDFGFCATRAKLLILSGTVMRVSEITTDHCWQNIRQIISDQQNLCCLGFFSEHCESKGLGSKPPCQPLFWHHILVVYSLLFTVIIVVCNGCVFVYKAFRHDVDAPLISNLAVADFLLIIPLIRFTNWHVLHGTRITFFEPFLAPNIWCSISGYVLTAIAHLSTWFSLFISLVKYCGIVHMKNVLADYKLQLYLVIVCAWSGVAAIGVLLSLNDTATPTTFVACLFGQHQSIKRQLLVVYSATNTVITIVSVCLYSSILRVIFVTHRKRTIGQKHGGVTYSKSVIKLIAINVCSSIAVMSQAIILTCVFFEIDVSTQSIVSSLVIMIPLKPICNPFLYSLSTKRFITYARSLFNNNMGLHLFTRQLSFNR